MTKVDISREFVNPTLVYGYGLEYFSLRYAHHHLVCMNLKRY